MTERLIQRLVEAFISNELISEEQKEEYIYSMLCLVETAITIASILFVGGILGKLLPTICFCLCFFLLRHRTGGFHLSSFAKCYVGSLILFGIVIYSNMMLEYHKLIFWSMAFLSSVVIAIFGTVNHPNLNLNCEEVRGAKKSARWMLGMEVYVILFMKWMHVNYEILSYSGAGIILCAFLLIIAKITRQKVKE